MTNVAEKLKSSDRGGKGSALGVEDLGSAHALARLKYENYLPNFANFGV